VDIRSQCEVSSGGQLFLVDDPTIQQPGFDLPRQRWSLLNHFWTAQGHCGACKKKWNQAATDLCPCGEKQTMFYLVNSCSLTKLNGSVSQLHSANDEVVASLMSGGS